MLKYFMRTRQKFIIMLISMTISLFAVAVQECYAQDTLVDPTRPMPDAAGAYVNGIDDNGLALDAIIYSPTRSSAIINGQAVSVGDTVGGFKLTEIHLQSVVLQSTDGRTITLSLLNDEIKHPVS